MYLESSKKLNHFIFNQNSKYLRKFSKNEEKTEIFLPKIECKGYRFVDNAKKLKTFKTLRWDKI